MHAAIAAMNYNGSYETVVQFHLTGTIGREPRQTPGPSACSVDVPRQIYRITRDTVTLEVRPADTGIASEWTDAPGHVHLPDHGFDDYGTEVVHLDAPYDAREAIETLAWDATHRQWTGSEWRLDFAALDQAIRHLLERGYTVTIPASDVRLYVADFDAPFLETHLQADPPVDVDRGSETGDDAQQSDLQAFDRDSRSDE